MTQGAANTEDYHEKVDTGRISFRYTDVHV
jgi:hypothetical protein